MSEFLHEGRHTVDVIALVKAEGEADLGSDPEVAPGSEPTLRELRWVGPEELRGITLLPGHLKERLLADGLRGPSGSEIYLGGGADA